MFIRNIKTREREIYRLALIIIFVSFFIDIVTTWYGVSYFGEKEGVPIAYWFMSHFGFNEALVLGSLVKIVAFIAFILLFNKINNTDSKALNIPRIFLVIPSIAIALVAVFYLIMLVNNLIRIII